MLQARDPSRRGGLAAGEPSTGPGSAGRPDRRCRSLPAGTLVIALACQSSAPTIPEPHLRGVEPEVEQELRSRRAAVASVPDDGERWGRFGMALDAHGFELEAETAYQQAAALDPDQFRWPYFQAALVEARSLEGAVDLYRSALQVDADYGPAHVRLAQALERLGRHEEALRSYRRAQELDSDNPFPPLGLGSIALRRGEVAAAVAHLERAHELDAGIHATVSALANAYHRAGDTERGRRLATEARRLPRITYQPDDLRAEIKEAAVDRRSHVRRAVTYRDVGQLERALHEARSARARSPQDVQSQLLVADIEYRLRDFAAAEASAREALRLAPHRDDLRELLARVLYERGNFGEAVALAEVVLRTDTEQANMHMLLGRVAGQRGRSEEAIRHLERAVASRPEAEEWRLTLASVLIAAGRAEEGRAQLLRLVASNPGMAEAWTGLGHSYLDRGDPAAAERALERAMALGAWRAALPGLAHALAATKGSAEAERRLETMVAAGGESSALARLLLADSLAARGRTEEARQHLSGLLAHQPDWAEAWLQLGVLELAAGRPDAAAAALERALETARDPALAARVAEGLEALGRHTGAP